MINKNVDQFLKCNGNQVISAFVFQSLSIFCEKLCIKIQLCMLENASNLYFKIGLRLLF